MLKKISLSAVALLVLLGFSQPAMSRDFAEIYIDCGLGAIIAPKYPVVAVVTNVTWDLGTTAVISNILSPETCVGGQAQAAAFISDSYASLEKDLASGSGEYLDSLMEVAGCEPEVHLELKTALRSDFTNIVAEPGYTDQSHFEQTESLYNALYKHIDGSFSKSCG